MDKFYRSESFDDIIEYLLQFVSIVKESLNLHFKKTLIPVEKSYLYKLGLKDSVKYAGLSDEMDSIIKREIELTTLLKDISNCCSNHLLLQFRNFIVYKHNEINITNEIDLIIRKVHYLFIKLRKYTVISSSDIPSCIYYKTMIEREEVYLMKSGTHIDIIDKINIHIDELKLLNEELKKLLKQREIVIEKVKLLHEDNIQIIHKLKKNIQICLENIIQSELLKEFKYEINDDIRKNLEKEIKKQLLIE